MPTSSTLGTSAISSASPRRRLHANFAYPDGFGTTQVAATAVGRNGWSYRSAASAATIDAATGARITYGTRSRAPPYELPRHQSLDRPNPDHVWGATLMAIIEHISDTARWVAMYRAMETDRPDAHFRDPLARTLAGERGAAILRGMPDGESTAWPMIVRTAVFDEMILKAIRERGVKVVVNLAAGLDARPYRLDLSSNLEWIEVDLPAMTRK